MNALTINQTNNQPPTGSDPYRLDREPADRPGSRADERPVAVSWRARLPGLPDILRFAGAAILVAALSVFLFQRWEQGTT